MTFSTNSIGTIEEVKEHFRSHHLHDDKDTLHIATHQKAKESTLAEIEEFAKRGHTHVSANVSGHTYTQLNGIEGISFSVSVHAVESDTHGARIYDSPVVASTDLNPE